ncbi:MAG: DUF481 domain-containing protein [Limisphaerales bacterium]
MPKPQRHNFIPVLLLLLLAFSWNVQAQQVVLQLKNGDRLTGKIATETTNQIVLTTTWSNNITIPADWISKREVVAVTNPPVVIVASNAPTPILTIPLAPARAIAPPAPVVILTKTPQHWHYEAQVGINLQYNQVTSQLYYGAFKTLYTGDLWRDVMDLKVNYGKADGTLSANNASSTWRVEHDVNKTKRMFVFNAVGAGYDQVRQIHFTYDESVGAGYKFIERPNLILTGDSGANYQKEFFYQHVQQDNFSLRLAEMVSWKVNPRVTFDEKFEFYPRVTSWSDYRLRAEANIAYKLNTTGSLFLNLGVVDLYDTQPAVNVSQNDLQFRSSLGLKF